MTFGTDFMSRSSRYRHVRGRFILRKVTGRISWWSLATIIAFFGGLLQLSLSELNPDWWSYQVMYESGGAWLSEQGRDPAFLMLTGLLAHLLGAQGYETYRTCLALYFLLFVALLSSGRIFKANPANGGHMFSVIALVYLGLTRFTIQIREGIAMTLVIFSLAIIGNRSNNQEQSSTGSSGQPLAPGALEIGVAVSLLIAAGLTHAATFLVLLIFMAALWVTRKNRTVSGEPLRRRAGASRLRVLWLVAFVLAVLGVAQLYLGGPLRRVAVETVGDRLMDARAMGALQLGLWGLYGGACWLLYREVRTHIRRRRIGGAFATFVQILSGPAVMATYVSIVLALMLAIAPLFITGYVRLLNMFLALVLICLAFTGCRKWPMLPIGVFLVGDQVRSLIAPIAVLL